MGRWQYCVLTVPDDGAEPTLGFSHDQGAALLAEFQARFPKGLRGWPASTSATYNLDMKETPSVWIAGWLGERGWELVSVAGYSNGHSWTFKKEY
jgi:hypothetical protein